MGLSGNVSGSVGGSIIFDGGTGTDDYRELTHKPSINGVPLNGAMTSEDLHIPTDAVEDVKVNGNSVVSGGVASITIADPPVTDVIVNGNSVMSGTVARIEETVQDVKVDGSSVVSNHTANIHIPVVDVEVNHMSVVSQGVAEIDITPAPVQDVKVNGQSVLFNRVANISVPSVPVQDVTVNGQSVMEGTTAKVLVPAPPVTDVTVDGQSVMDGTVAKVISPSVPVQDVTVNGTSVMDGTTAKVLVPAPPVTDVTVDGQSVMDGTVAKVISPSVPVQDVTVNGQSVMDGTTAKVLVPDPPVTDVKVNNQSVVSQGIADINITPPPVTDVQLNGQSVLVATIANVAPKASDVAINPAISGMSATNCQEGFSELKGTLTDKVDKIDTTGIKVFHGNGTHQYCKVATITITNTYAGRPIVFELAGRAIEYATIQVEFNNANNTDPTLKSFKTSGTQTNYYIKKTATSTWEIYCDIINTWAYLYLFREIEPRDYDNITVTINMTGVTALPSGCTQVTSILNDLQSVVTIGSDADFINVLNSMSVYEVKPVFFKSTFIQPWFNSGYQNYGGYMVKHTDAIADGFGFDSGVGNAIVFRGTKSGTTLNVTNQKKVTFTAI